MRTKLKAMLLFAICLVAKRTSAERIPSVLNLSPDKSFTKFIEVLKSMEFKRIVYESDDPVGDLLKYNAGLTNEDKYLNATQLIKKYGYPVENYEVATPDGYLVGVTRIPGAGPPVLLMHGLLCSADEFLTSGPGGALAYTLADARYDLWMGNARGNKYSRKHTSVSPEESQFWNFSFHEVGLLDLPTIIDFILKKVGQPKLYYVGHSLGTTSCYVLLSEKPEYNDKIIVAVSLSPVAWMDHISNPVLQALAPFVNEEYLIGRVIGFDEFAPETGIIALLRGALCGTSVMAAAVCAPVVFSIGGFDFAQANFTNLFVQINHLPAGGATKQVIHYIQEIKSGKFQQFDYGEAQNMIKYGSPAPPEYDVTKISTKVALFYSSNDWLSSPIDVLKLARKLPNVRLVHKIPVPYCHTDFIWGKNAKELVYLKIIDLFKENQG